MKGKTLLAMLVACGLLARLDGLGQLVITPVVVTRDPAPGTAAGVNFSAFQDVHIDDSGRVLFIGTLTGPGTTSTNRHGIWTGWPGNMRLVARTGKEAPSSPGARFRFFAQPNMDGHNGVMFFATLTSPEGTASLAAGGSDLGSSFFSLGEPLDSFFGKLLDGVEWLIFGEPRRYILIEDYKHRKACSLGLEDVQVKLDTNALGAVSTPARDAIIISSTNDIAAVAIVGETAPGTTEELLGIAQLAVNAGTNVAFTGRIAAGAALWLGRPNHVRPVILPNAAAPPSLAVEFGNQARFGDDLFSLGLNPAEHIACVAEIVAAGQARYAVLAGPHDRLRAVARERASSSAQGFIGFDKLVLNAAGDVAFTASHTVLGGIPGLARGVWLTHRLGAPALVLAEGQPTTGLTNGEVISFLEEGPYMNRLGQVALRAGIGSAVGFENTRDKGLWLIDPARGPQLVARGGTTIDIGGGQTRQLLTNAAVAFISTHDVPVSGGDDGRPTPFNNLGQLVFIAQWQDPNGAFRSGVFIANEVRMIQPLFDGNDAFVSFPTRAGKRYRVEYREDVVAGTWNVLADQVPGTGGILTITNAEAGLLSKRFYRVSLWP